MPSISTKGNLMPESPIRKLVPYAEKAKQKGIKVFHLNIGQPDIETPKNAINAVKNADIKILAYSKSEGDLVLRKKISEYYKTFNVLVSSSEIIVTSGASEALLFSIGSIMDPNDEIIIPEPFYANYNGFSVANGVKITPIFSSIDDNFSLPNIEEFEKITGQKPIVTRAKKAIAGFKIRENMELGLSVTLRGEKMYAFLTKLLFFTFAQIRDFRGLSLRSFDKAGNYHFGLKEQLIFPEVDYDEVDQTQGVTINIILEHSSPKYKSKSIDKILNGMILFKFLRFPLNDCGYYEKYSSFIEVNQVWDRKKYLKRKRWSQE